MKSVFFTSANQDYSKKANRSLQRKEAIKAFFSDIYCCPHMRMSMPY